MQLTITADQGKIYVKQGADTDNDSGGTSQSTDQDQDQDSDNDTQGQPVKNFQALMEIIKNFINHAAQTPQNNTSPFDQALAQQIPGRGAGLGGAQQPQQTGGM